MVTKLKVTIEVLADIVGDKDLCGIERALDQALSGKTLTYFRGDDFDIQALPPDAPKEDFIVRGVKLEWHETELDSLFDC